MNDQILAPLLDGTSVQLSGLAERASYSRHHFQRVFKRLMGETPGEMRRRLMLERAAWLLGRQELSSTATAFEVGFESLEGFSRAFKRHFGVPPSQFAGERERSFWLPAKNGVHFTPVITKGHSAMDLLDRFLDSEHDICTRLLSIDSALLDTRLPYSFKAHPWETAQTTLRELFDWMIFTKEVWLAAVEKAASPEHEGRDTTPEGLRRRFEIVSPMFAGLVRRVRQAGEWNTQFCDELCDPPQMFSFGGMIAHVMTQGIYRRQVALETLRQAGQTDLGWGDPLDWELKI